MAFNLYSYGLVPVGYTPNSVITGTFVRPARFEFPRSSLWSPRKSKYREVISGGRVLSVTVELEEHGSMVHSRTITEQEYQGKLVYSAAPKLPWRDFVQVLKVFMMGDNQEHATDIERAFGILDQQRNGTYSRTITVPDGLISPDELRAFLSILTDPYRVDLCVLLADTDGSGQINRVEFDRMIKSGLARDIVCGRI